MFVNWKIERYERLGDSTWETVPELINDFYDVMVRETLGDGKDTFSFKINNVANRYDNYWNVGDKVIIYYKVNGSSFTDDDILMNGLVTDLPDNVTGSKNVIEVKGNNYSESLVNALVFVSPPETTGFTIPNMIQAAINSVAVHNPNFQVTWHPDNPTTQEDGSSFPAIYERWYYKTMLSLLERYSSNNYTQDGNYYWYVDKDNKLVWRKEKDNSSDSFNTNTDDYKSLKISKDTKGIVNFVIAKGGTDPKGAAISTRYDDAVSRSKHGFKYKIIISETNTGRHLMDLDQKKHGAQSNFPSSYDFTTAWEKQDGTGTVTVSSDSEYTIAVREEVKYRLADEAKKYVDEYRNGKLIVEVVFDNGKGWNLGDVISVTIPKLGKTGDPMRVNDIQITQDTEVYGLIEDEGTI